MRNLTFYEILSILRFYLRKEESLDNRIAEFFADSARGRVVVLNKGRSAMQAAINRFKLQGSEIILPSWICSDVFVPLFMQNQITPRIVDCQKNSVHMDFNQVRIAITKETKALLLVHTYGIPENVEKYRKLCDEKGILLIEDCAHALRVKSNAGYLGSCGDAAIFSFVKEIPCFSGGAYINNSKPSKEPSIGPQTLFNYLREGMPLFLQKLSLFGLIKRAFKKENSERNYRTPVKEVFPTSLSKIGKAAFCALVSRYNLEEKRIIAAALYAHLRKSKASGRMLLVPKEKIISGSAKCVPLIVSNKKETISALERAGFNPGRGWVPCFSTNPLAHNLWKLPQTPMAEYYEKHLINIDLDELDSSNIEKFSAILEEINS